MSAHAHIAPPSSRRVRITDAITVIQAMLKKARDASVSMALFVLPGGEMPFGVEGEESAALLYSRVPKSHVGTYNGEATLEDVLEDVRLRLVYLGIEWKERDQCASR